MAHNIEVDDEVYVWLQKYGVPFEDDPNSVLRRIKQRVEDLDNGRTPNEATSVSAKQATSPTAPSTGQRPKLDHRVLQRFGVSHFVVNGKIPEYRGARSRRSQRAHERAYLDARLDSGEISDPYYQRWKERGLPNPRGDAASRVILKVGAEDTKTRVCFHDGREMNMSEFIEAFLGGTL